MPSSETNIFSDLDPALQLRIMHDRGDNIPDKEIDGLLHNSTLVKELTENHTPKTMFSVWRLIALSEIPYAERLPYTQNLIQWIYKHLATPLGFSLSGNEKQFLPCYNSMLISALCRLGRAEDEEVSNAVQWIMQYQPFERGVLVTHPKIKFDRFGGCYKKIPCYISIAKAVMALIEYNHCCPNAEIDAKISQGVEYILSHQVYKRLSNDKPITKYITELSFPESYHTNLVDLLRILHRSDKLLDQRAEDAIQMVSRELTPQGGWRVSFRYKADGYRTFDKGRKPAHWLSYILHHVLDGLTVEDALWSSPYQNLSF